MDFDEFARLSGGALNGKEVWYVTRRAQAETRPGDRRTTAPTSRCCRRCWKSRGERLLVHATGTGAAAEPPGLKPIDVVFCDPEMPRLNGGYEMPTRLRDAYGSQVPVIAYTALPPETPPRYGGAGLTGSGQADGRRPVQRVAPQNLAWTAGMGNCPEQKVQSNPPQRLPPGEVT
ncbi:MAG: hypothetical protein IPK19_24625 [Chloroflexi bacterium]|nr:hypothetical protein [Chloroflexota bacterium]